MDLKRRSAELCSCCCDTDINEGKSDLIVSALELSTFSSQTWNDLYKWNIFQNLQVYKCKNTLIYYETGYLRTTAAAGAAEEACEPVLM